MLTSCSIADVKSFVGAYLDSIKESDMTIWPQDSFYPTVVLEVGWSESWEQLSADCKLWSDGTGYGVNVTILVKMYRPNSQGVVRAKIEITSYGTQGLL